MNTNICFSGAAAGADHAWGLMALDRGHDLIHFSFKGHKTHDLTNIEILGREQLIMADEFVIEAAKSMKRRYPSAKENINNLLRRNWYQVRYAERVYAISNLSDTDPGCLKITGGTAWACQMYVDRWYSERNFPVCELYLYDMASNKWMQWWETWKEIERPPVPHGRYAGIGSRDLTDDGIRAIFSAYG